MADELVIAGRYGNTAEAHAARLALDAEGIEAFVGDDASADMLSIMATGLGGVKLLVPRSQLKRAQRILERDHSRKKPAVPAWICQQCGSVVDAGFEVCWSCGAEYDPVHSRRAPSSSAEDEDDGDDEVVARSPSEQERGQATRPSPDALEEDEWRCPACGLRIDKSHAECPACGAGPDAAPNPYVAADAEPGAIGRAPVRLHETEEISAMLRRAWYAAVLGIVLCPGVTQLYSLYLLMRIGMSGVELTPKGNRRFYLTLAIDLLVPVSMWGVWLLATRPYR